MVRLVQRVFPPLKDAESYEADFVDAAEMVVVARALRAHGYGARMGETPLRLVVTIPGAVRIPIRLAATGGVK